jgi:hypothetical protein
MKTAKRKRADRAEQAAEGHATLQRALAGASVLVAVLRLAEARFMIARAAAGYSLDHSR